MTTDLTKKEPTPQEKAVALLEAKAKETQTFIESFKAEIVKALPKFLDGERMMRVIFTTLRKNPKLYQAERGSLINAILTSAQLGLEPDGVLGQATILPYENRSKGIIEAQFQPMYKGLVDLLYRTGLISNLHTGILYENEYKDPAHWEYELGFDFKLRHRPMEPRLRGVEKVGAYCVVLMKDGTKHAVFMWGSDIIKRRDMSPGWKAAKHFGKTDSSPWTQWEEGMWQKTVVKEASKLLKLSAEDVSRDVAKAIAADAEDTDDEDFGRTGVIDAEVLPTTPTTGTAAFDNALGAGEQSQGPTEEEKAAIAQKRADAERAAAEAAAKKKAPPAGKKAAPPPAGANAPAGNPDYAAPETVAKIKALANEVITNYAISQTDFLARFTTSPHGVPLTGEQFREGKFSEQDARRYRVVITEYVTIKEGEKKQAADKAAAEANAAGQTRSDDAPGTEPPDDDTGATEPERIARLDDDKVQRLWNTVQTLTEEFGISSADALERFSKFNGSTITQADYADGFIRPGNAAVMQASMDAFIPEERARRAASKQAPAPKSPNRSVAPPSDPAAKVRDTYLGKPALKPAERQGLAGDLLAIIVDNPAYLAAAQGKYGKDINSIVSGINKTFIATWYRYEGDMDAAINHINDALPGDGENVHDINQNQTGNESPKLF